MSVLAKSYIALDMFMVCGARSGWLPTARIAKTRECRGCCTRDRQPNPRNLAARPRSSSELPLEESPQVLFLSGKGRFYVDSWDVPSRESTVPCTSYMHL